MSFTCNAISDSEEVIEVAEDENGTKGETITWLCVELVYFSERPPWPLEE